MMRKTLFVCAFAIAGALAAVPASAQSSKAAWRFDELIDLASAAAADPGSTANSNDTGWQTVLTTHIKTPNGKELAIGASLQCGLVTDTTVRSKNGDLDGAAAQARIAVRVRITQPDNTVVYAEPDNSQFLTDLIPTPTGSNTGVTYCDRYQKLEAKFLGLDCFVDVNDFDGDGNTTEIVCNDEESLRLILKTLSAHHFNFLHANAVPGVHRVEVQARAQSAAALDGTRLGAAGAAAIVGAGAVSVETIRLVKDANGTVDLSDLR